MKNQLLMPDKKVQIKSQASSFNEFSKWLPCSSPLITQAIDCPVKKQPGSCSMTSQRAAFLKCQSALIYILSLRCCCWMSAANKFFMLCFFFFFSWVWDKLWPPVFIHPARPRSLQLSQFVPRVNNSKSSFWSRASVSGCETFFFFFYTFNQAHVLRSFQRPQ